MIEIDGDVVRVFGGEETSEFLIGSPEAFSIISSLWLRSGWDTKYVYSFSWLGRPIIQLPEDLLRIQELIFELSPDIVIETGVAHGGSLVFYASLFSAMGKGRVVGVDIEIRPNNRKAIEEHRMSEYITLIEGSSTDPNVVSRVFEQVKEGEVCMVILDSCHSRDHVFAELEAYAPLVSKGSYIVACDGVMAFLVGAPRSEPDWGTNNPIVAVNRFLEGNSCFELVEPKFPFNEGEILERVTYWPSAYLRRL